jgi:hypothetical protein
MGGATGEAQSPTEARKKKKRPLKDLLKTKVCHVGSVPFVDETAAQSLVCTW